MASRLYDPLSKFIAIWLIGLLAICAALSFLPMDLPVRVILFALAIGLCLYFGRSKDAKLEKAVQFQLEQSEKRFRAIFQSNLLGMVIANREGYMIEVNQTFAKMIGYTADELHKMRFTQITHPDDIETDWKLFKELWAETTDNYQIPKRYIHKNGTIIWVLLYVSRYANSASEPLEIALIEDISARTEAEESLYELNTTLEKRIAERTAELEVVNRQLADLDRLKSKFVADVSHELRTPLSVLNTRAHLIERGGPARLHEYLPGLKEQLSLMNRLVASILDMSHFEWMQPGGAVEELDLNRIAQIVINSFKPQAESLHLNLVFEAQADLPFIKGYTLQVEQVINSLLSNALSYTPSGSVTVATHYAAGAKEVTLSVQDTGIGIPDEDLPHIFEPFYRGKAVSQLTTPGVGLGLRVVKTIMEAHYGDVTVSTTIAVGSTFTLHFKI